MLRKNAQINTTAWTQPCISLSLNNTRVLPTWGGGGNPSPHDPAAPLFPSATSCARAGRGCSAGRRPREGTERMRILGRCCRLRHPRHLRGLYVQSERSPFPTFFKVRVQQAEARNRVRIEILQCHCLVLISFIRGYFPSIPNVGILHRPPGFGHFQRVWESY